jgi:alcohol dehydrogenase
MQSYFSPKFLYRDIDSVESIIEELKKLSVKNVFVVADKNVSNPFYHDLLRSINLHCGQLGIYLHDGKEPSTDLVDELRLKLKTVEVESIIGIGGGSTLDLMKAVSVMHFIDTPAAQAQGKSIQIVQKIFSIAIPTTAGSGSESTKSAVLTNKAAKIKRGINHPKVLPEAVFLSQKLLEGIPESVFVASVFDGFTHALESYLGKSGNLTVKYLAQESIAIYVRQLRKLKDSKGLVIDSEILNASNSAGVAICNSETGPIHAISYPLSEQCRYNHGQAIGLILPRVISHYCARSKEIENSIERVAGMSCQKLINLIDEIYLNRISRTLEVDPVSEITILAERSLQLLGAVANSPLEWKLSDSVAVLALL